MTTTYLAAYDTESAECRAALPQIVKLHERHAMPATFFLVSGIVPGHEVLGGSDAKYLSAAGMQKSELLYGLTLAENAMQIYVVEGPADAWRVGPGALALFGKDLSQTQKLLLVHHFPGRRIIVMLDQDAREEAHKIQQDLRLARGPSGGEVLLATLPPGRKDPGDCPPEEIANCHVEA